MFLAGESKRFQAWIALEIKKVGARRKLYFFFAVGEDGRAVEIEANFDAVRVEGGRPVEIAGGLEFMPLEAETQFGEASKHRPPAGADRAPGGSFRKGRWLGSDGFGGKLH